MWAIIAILIVAGAIFFMEVPKLKKKKQIKDMWYVIILLALATAATLYESTGMETPNPLDFIQSVYAPIRSWFQN
ncbi:hypothetical protein [Thalassobacillus sp. CUG 92003]|uniref:hypothetical protein n=1 Tax=Thalassobacillus sp. CUG 92003 TaxID=2736641 RepID=UPI0015E6DAB3|nr:hypothetical protein [Thalassobacillus sp. CUG 92003]